MRSIKLSVLAVLCFLATSVLGQNASQALQNDQDVLNSDQANNQTLVGQYLRYYGDLSLQSSANVRFLRFDKVDDERKKTIREDAAVLNHMISKELPLKSSRSALGVAYAYAYGKNEIVYDDNGLRLVYFVPMPLVPDNSEKSENRMDEKPKSKWDMARQELNESKDFRFGNKLSRGEAGGVVGLGGGALGGGDGFGYVNNVQPMFDQDYVDHITEQIRTALASAGNIRDLSDDDMVSVFVYGAGPEAGTRSLKAWRVRWKSLGGKSTPDPSVVEENTYLETDSANAKYYYNVTSGAR